MQKQRAEEFSGDGGDDEPFIDEPATSAPLFFTVEGRPLPPLSSVRNPSVRRPMDFYVQAVKPFRRPSGAGAAGSRLPAPSGAVPGGIEVGCAEFQIVRGGDGAELDCVFLFYSEVQSPNCKGLSVISVVVEALLVKCNSRNTEAF